MALRGVHVPLQAHSATARHVASMLGGRSRRATGGRKRRRKAKAARSVKRRVKRKLKRLVKGSKAAKAHMAKIRRKRR